MKTDLGLERLATLLQASLRDSAARHGISTHSTRTESDACSFGWTTRSIASSME